MKVGKVFGGIILWLLWVLFCAIGFAWAQQAGSPEVEVSFAGYGIPVLISIVMGLVYRFVPAIPDRYKALITILVGIGFGVGGIFYEGLTPTFRIVADYAIAGLMDGASAVGLYEGVYRTAAKPRS